MNYDELSLVELKELAKQRKIKGISLKKKAELIEILLADDRFAAGQKEKEAEEKRAGEEKKEAEQKAENAERNFRRTDETLRRPDTANRRMQDQSYGRMQLNQRRYDRPQTGDRPQMRERPQMGERSMSGDRPQMGDRMRRYDRPVMPQRQQNSDMPARSENQGNAPAERKFSAPVAENRALRPSEEERTVRPAMSGESSQPRLPGYDVQGLYTPEQIGELDSGVEKNGILEIMPEGFAFIRCDNFLPGEEDVYVSPIQLRQYGLRSGDMICGNTKIKTATEKFPALLYIKNVNGFSIEETLKRKKFETLTPVFPHERIHLETPGSSVAMRLVDLVAPIGMGQRGMIVSQPKSGKTTLLKEIANSITKNHSDMHLIILLIDERPEEVTDMKESIRGQNVEVIYSTFDEHPDKHKRVSEMVIEHAKRLVEYGKDVVILLDSITRLARAYNLTVVSSGKTLSGGLDPAALYMPKKFFGAARTMREGGSLTILATALVETGSRMDDVVFEEFKGTGNMELVLDRNLSERRIFPAIDLAKSGTRRDDLLLSKEEAEAMVLVRRALNGAHAEDATETLINMCAHTKNKNEFVNTIKKGLKP